VTELTVSEPTWNKYHRVMLVISVLIVAVFLFLPMLTPVDKAHAVGYAICHQIPERTFHIEDTPLPLCARCTGIYLGALMGLAGMWLLGRRRSTKLPPPLVLVILIGFTLTMGLDGINSYLSFFSNAPQLYQPQNWLRLTTGTFHGLTMIAILFPLVNESLWDPDYAKQEPVIKNIKELLFFILGETAAILVVLWRPPLLLYPLTFLSAFGVMLMLTLVMTVFALFFIRRMGYARTWNDLALPLIMGLAMAISMIAGMYWFRLTVTEIAGLPI
jgi:uncharacterized membrane protein